MPQSFIILDDFLPDPMPVRDHALKLSYPTPEKKTAFPGRNSDTLMTIEGAHGYIERVLGERLTPTPGTGHGKCRLTLKSDTGFGGVHIDESEWSGILYLSKPEDSQGGTDFYRHKATGTDHAPRSHQQLLDMGCKTVEDLWDTIIWPDTKDPEKWEKVMTIPMRFNRLVLFRPWYWHNAGAGFGTTPENGRLVQLYFFNGLR